MNATARVRRGDGALRSFAWRLARSATTPAMQKEAASKLDRLLRNSSSEAVPGRRQRLRGYPAHE